MRDAHIFFQQELVESAENRFARARRSPVSALDKVLFRCRPRSTRRGGRDGVEMSSIARAPSRARTREQIFALGARVDLPIGVTRGRAQWLLLKHHT
jgi:hypothetical protein